MWIAKKSATTFEIEINFMCATEVKIKYQELKQMSIENWFANSDQNIKFIFEFKLTIVYK